MFSIKYISTTQQSTKPYGLHLTISNVTDWWHFIVSPKRKRILFDFTTGFPVDDLWLFGLFFLCEWDQQVLLRVNIVTITTTIASTPPITAISTTHTETYWVESHLSVTPISDPISTAFDIFNTNWHWSPLETKSVSKKHFLLLFPLFSFYPHGVQLANVTRCH